MNIVPTSSIINSLPAEVNELYIEVKSFPLFPSTIEVLYRVIGPDTSYENVITLPQNIVDAWGTDDTVIQNYVATAIGVSITE